MEKELLELRKELFETKDMNKVLMVQIYNLRKELKDLKISITKKKNKVIELAWNKKQYVCRDCWVTFEKDWIRRNNLKYCDVCSKKRYDENQREQTEKQILKNKLNINGKPKGKRQIVY